MMQNVDQIYGKKVSQGSTYYYVKLKGKPESENTWMAAENIKNLHELSEIFARVSSDETSSINMRKGSFSNNDEVKKVTQIVWNEETSESLGEVEWKSQFLYNSLYPLSYLHEKCPRETCELYYSLLKFTYTP